MSKAQQLEERIKKVELDIEKRKKEVRVLNKKEAFYLEEIESLKLELENSKQMALDEVHALGMTGPVVRDFYK